MARIDLNIIDRGISGSDWVAENIGLTPEHLDDVKEMKTDNSMALNSLPTPFARFFVASEAFRRAKEEHLDKSKDVGFAYKQMVSDILDVYELLFNLKFHVNNSWKNGQKVELREWKAAENLAYIKGKMPVLYNSIESYFKTDIKEEKLYFLIFIENGKEKLLACSSPYTGFVTPPDMDKTSIRVDGTITTIFADQTKNHDSKYKNMQIHRKSGGTYFLDTKMFEERDPEFKNYMYNELFGSDNVDVRLKSIKEYIRSFKDDPDIRNDFRLRMASVKTDQNEALEINGLSIKSSNEIDVTSFFTPTLIKVPYRISRKTNKAVNYKNDEDGRNYDFLLPFKPEILSLVGGQEIDSYVNINRNSVTVVLKFDGKIYEKEYAADPFKAGQGKIVDLQRASIKFDLGLFPNILSSKEEENNYFKMLIVAADEDSDAPNFNIDEISLRFFKDGAEIREMQPNDGAVFGVLPAFVRSRQKSDSLDSGTKFYELFGSSFDAIEVNIMGETGLLMPIWEQGKMTDDTFTYAIDLGTSNTFISRKKDGANYQPELFKMERPMVSYLHEVPEDKQLPQSRLIENSIFEQAQNKIKTEFVPALIDGNDYKFPIRTALCGINSPSASAKPNLFDNLNIAFFYERMMSNEDQNIHTDIKWEENEDELRIFVRELMLIIKCDVLQHNGDLDRTNLIWFRPLSFTGTTKSLYDDIWYGTPGSQKGEPEKILFVQPSQIQCFTESEAPYYYFKKKAIIPNSDAVTVIDIGGGSSDFVYFKDNQPKVAASVHFGCDVLWGNGFVDFDNARENGIYQKYANTLQFDTQNLTDLNDNLKLNTQVKTNDIINFWLSNATHCEIAKLLRNDFKPVFIYHFTSILFYMANMYKDNGLDAPNTVVFSGNGSKYIDSFISTDSSIIKKMIDLILDEVFAGEKHDINLQLPLERKESTCYGGLFREADAASVPEINYQGDNSFKYETVREMNDNSQQLKKALLLKYQKMAHVYAEVLNLLKKENIIDAKDNAYKYVEAASASMEESLNTYYKTQVTEPYKQQDDVPYNDSVFFLPVIDRIFNLTKIG